MKATFYAFLLTLFLGGSRVQAQLICIPGDWPATCTTTIPSDVIVVDSVMTVSFANGDCFWVCTGDSLFLIGAANCKVYLEPGAFVNDHGGENVVWVKETATCVVDTGSNTNFIRYVTNSTFIDNGVNTLDTLCSTITYNYTSAPVPGCQGTGLQGQLATQNLLQVFPNPGTASVTITNTGEINESWGLQLYDVLGNLVLEINKITTNNIRVFVGQLESGAYIGGVTGERNKWVRLVVE